MPWIPCGHSKKLVSKNFALLLVITIIYSYNKMYMDKCDMDIEEYDLIRDVRKSKGLR